MVIFIFSDRSAATAPRIPTYVLAVIVVKAIPWVGDGGDLDEEAAFSINIGINL